MPEILQFVFPIFTLAGKEEVEVGRGDFDPTVPTQKQTKKDISPKPNWVKNISRVESTLTPIVLDGAIPIFDSEQVANIVIGEEELTIKFGEIEIMSLGSVDAIEGWIEKIHEIEKVRLYVWNNSKVAIAEVGLEDFVKSVKLNTEMAP